MTDQQAGGTSPDDGTDPATGPATDGTNTPDGTNIAALAEAEPVVRPRPRRMNPQELGFTPRPPVPWLAPLLLISTGLRSLLALIFGAYLDKRELQNSLPDVIYRGIGTDGSLWLDYVADLGDGFHATYSVAYLLGQPELQVDGHRLPRAELLMMGGDQVYPTASTDAYEDRCKGPYEAALPQAPADGAPSLFAMPGNHDWYDGLTAFLRTFARSRDANIGGWRTRQTRSYFAIELPANWWLLALDESTEAYLDDPQLRYFEQAATQLGPQSRVILAVPTPAWVLAVDHPRAYDTIDYFIRTVLAPRGAQVRLLISGDLHHYARYEGPDRQLITCGGGGAYLYPTHKLRKQIEVPPKDTLSRQASRSRSYRLAARYPKAARSRRYSWGIFRRLPLRNPGFITLLGTLHTLLMLAMAGLAAQQPDSTDQRLFSLPLAVMLLTTVLGAAFFAQPPSKRHFRHWMLGLSHGFAHIGLGALGTWVWLGLPFQYWQWPMPAVAGAVIYGPIIGVVASQLTAAYLLVAGTFGVNLNELFAAQGIEDAKIFLRMHIAADGTLTGYPVAVDRICRRWRANPEGAPDSPWLLPGSSCVPGSLSRRSRCAERVRRRFGPRPDRDGAAQSG